MALILQSRSWRVWSELDHEIGIERGSESPGPHSGNSVQNEKIEAHQRGEQTAPPAAPDLPKREPPGQGSEHGPCIASSGPEAEIAVGRQQDVGNTMDAKCAEPVTVSEVNGERPVGAVDQYDRIRTGDPRKLGDHLSSLCRLVRIGGDGVGRRGLGHADVLDHPGGDYTIENAVIKRQGSGVGDNKRSVRGWAFADPSRKSIQRHINPDGIETSLVPLVDRLAVATADVEEAQIGASVIAEKPGQERNPFGGSTGFESFRIAEELRYLGHIGFLGFHTFILITPH